MGRDEEITAEWMTAALADHFPGVEVDDVAVVLRDDGTIGPNLRNRCFGGVQFDWFAKL
jgi:hypothetical protein